VGKGSARHRQGGPSPHSQMLGSSRPVVGRVGPRSGMARRPAGRLVAEFAAALADDLDTPRAIRVLRRAIREDDAQAARWMLGILGGTASLG
jgi:hypothetical protein